MSDRSKRAFHHRLVWRDRGIQHLHRWHGSCPCGWEGVPGDAQWTEEQYALHRGNIDKAKRRGNGGGLLRQELTPAHLLPEALR